MASKVKFDRENTLLLLQQQSWVALIELFKDNNIVEEIQRDEIARSVLNGALVQELIGGRSLEESPDHLFYLEQFLILHSLPTYKFSLADNQVDRLAESVIAYYQDTKLETALGYAKRFPHLGISKSILEEFERMQPKVVSHSQSNTIYVTENREIASIDATTSLFKSSQEYYFYKAVREVFPSYLVFPNVALSSILNYEQIKEQLNQDERTYFFKALVDCVVIDPENEFRPFRMLEIDSVFHDADKQKVKDSMKDQIMAKAGQKLVRVRVFGSAEEQDLKKLVLETIR